MEIRPNTGKSRFLLWGTIFLGSGGIALWLWTSPSPGSADFRPVSFTLDQRATIDAIYRFLESQAISDGEMGNRVNDISVREFARHAAADHRDEADLLKKLVLGTDPQVIFHGPASTERLAHQSAVSGREYLNSFIRDHQVQLAWFQQVSSQIATPELDQFVVSWRYTLERHLREARELRIRLPANRHAPIKGAPRH